MSGISTWMFRYRSNNNMGTVNWEDVGPHRVTQTTTYHKFSPQSLSVALTVTVVGPMWCTWPMMGHLMLPLKSSDFNTASVQRGSRLKELSQRSKNSPILLTVVGTIVCELLLRLLSPYFLSHMLSQASKVARELAKAGRAGSW